MSKKKVDIIWLVVSIFFFLLFACSFLIMPMETKARIFNISVNTFVSGLMFWVSIVMGIVTQCILAVRKKKWYKMNHIKNVKSSQRLGLISFFRNNYATAADIVSAVSLIGFIVSMVVTYGTAYICYVFVSLFAFSFSMHCILNGKIFYHIVNRRTMIQVGEKETTKILKKSKE